jgi:hypothetical protein
MWHGVAVAELELQRVAGERRLYAVDGVGTIRLHGLVSRAATAEADGRRWRFERRSLWQRAVEATDETGEVAGTFEPRTIRRGGAVRWGPRELTLRAASSWRERYALADGERELATFDGKGWGRRPVAITVAEEADVEPGLLLFATFVVRGLAEDAGSAAVVASSAATTGS